MSNERYDELLELYLDQKLDAKQRVAVENRLLSSAEYAGKLADLSLVRDALIAMEEQDLPEGLHNRIMDYVTTASASGILSAPDVTHAGVLTAAGTSSAERRVLYGLPSNTARVREIPNWLKGTALAAAAALLLFVGLGSLGRGPNLVLPEAAETLTTEQEMPHLRMEVTVMPTEPPAILPVPPVDAMNEEDADTLSFTVDVPEMTNAVNEAIGESESSGMARIAITNPEDQVTREALPGSFMDLTQQIDDTQETTDNPHLQEQDLPSYTSTMSLSVNPDTAVVLQGSLAIPASLAEHPSQALGVQEEMYGSSEEGSLFTPALPVNSSIAPIAQWQLSLTSLDIPAAVVKGYELGCVSAVNLGRITFSGTISALAQLVSDLGIEDEPGWSDADRDRSWSESCLDEAELWTSLIITIVK
ncbi:MAG: hypothetical protein FWE76_00385 [Symbiobacteriaceae bacterium]|nr:hypothetical protein [Symbiobacteriaceae bacterium]